MHIALILLRFVLGGLLVASCVYLVLTVVAARRWRSSSPRTSAASPPVTILKPLRGADPEQESSFRTFLALDYPRYEVVFGALDPTDEGLRAAARTQDEFPAADVTVIAGGEPFGPNRKACNLHNMLPAARHDLLVLCDSDMRVAPNYLRRITAPFADPRVGLVTCLYRGCGAAGLAASLEALAIGADFAPSVLVANMTEGMSFAFGSTIALRRATLERLGGFAALADCIADDYLLGRRTRDLGLAVVLSDYVVDDVIGRVGWREMWARRVRWARTVRAMRPVGYLGSGVTHALVLALLFAGVCGMAPVALAALVGTMALRAATALLVARHTEESNVGRNLHLLPISDLVSFAVWVTGLLGSSVVWRGEHYRVGRDGLLRPRTTR